MELGAKRRGSDSKQKLAAEAAAAAAAAEAAEARVRELYRFTGLANFHEDEFNRVHRGFNKGSGCTILIVSWFCMGFNEDPTA